MPPSSSLPAKLVKKLAGRKNLPVIAEPYDPKKPADSIVRNTGAKAVRLSIYLGSDEKIQTYLENPTNNVDTIVDALK